MRALLLALLVLPFAPLAPPAAACTDLVVPNTCVGDRDLGNSSCPAPFTGLYSNPEGIYYLTVGGKRDCRGWTSIGYVFTSNQGYGSGGWGNDINGECKLWAGIVVRNVGRGVNQPMPICPADPGWGHLLP